MPPIATGQAAPLAFQTIKARDLANSSSVVPSRKIIHSFHLQKSNIDNRIVPNPDLIELLQDGVHLLRDGVLGTQIDQVVSVHVFSLILEIPIVSAIVSSRMPIYYQIHIPMQELATEKTHRLICTLTCPGDCSRTPYRKFLRCETYSTPWGPKCKLCARIGFFGQLRVWNRECKFYLGNKDVSC